MTPTQKLRVAMKALAFYADPDTYTAVMFLGDRPCGDFIRDISVVEDDFGQTRRPGKRARAALKKIRSALSGGQET